MSYSSALLKCESVVLVDFSVTVYVNEQNFGFEGAFLKAWGRIIIPVRTDL